MVYFSDFSSKYSSIWIKSSFLPGLTGFWGTPPRLAPVLQLEEFIVDVFDVNILPEEFIPTIYLQEDVVV